MDFTQHELNELFEEFESTTDPVDDTLPKEKAKNIVKVDRDLVKKVIDLVIVDPIIPDSIKETIKSINHDQLTEQLKSLDKIVVGGVFNAAAKEKSWRCYQEILPDLVSALCEQFPSLTLPICSFLCLRLAEMIIRENNISTPSDMTHSKLNSDETDIIAYIAGFILFRSKKKFCTVPSIAVVLEKLTDHDSNTKLIAVKTRGGLTQPVGDLKDFFVLVETIFRRSCTSLTSIPSLKAFVDSVCNDDEVCGLFYSCTYQSDSQAVFQEKLLSFMLSLFFRVRCNAKCRQTMERYLMKSRKCKKQKALRKSIDE